MSDARRTGRVVRVDAKHYHVEIDGEIGQFVPRGRLFLEDKSGDPKAKNPIAVGDRVIVSLEGDPPGIDEVLPRTNWLPRVASSHDPREQVLFANVDQLLIVGSVAQPGFSSSRTDRILAACQYHEIPAVLVLNKVDLDDGGMLADLRATYASAGIRVLETCALDGRGLDELRELLRGRVTAFYGASGAGKSTLLNTIQPGLDLKTGKISKYWTTGKHTTTFSRMLRLDAVDGWAIDTPGIRVFRPYGINRAELRDLFPEFARFHEGCRYPDCAHDHEPECAVFEAVERGDLAASRYQSYVELLDELRLPGEEGSLEGAQDS